MYAHKREVYTDAGREICSFSTAEVAERAVEYVGNCGALMPRETTSEDWRKLRELPRYLEAYACGA